MRITNQHADAVDCFQEVFLEVLRKKDASDVNDWGAYLRWLTTRRAIDLVRNRRRMRQRMEPRDTTLLVDDSVEESNIEFSELVQDVREQLFHMSQSQAQAFWLVCVEECSQAEVACQMKLSISHVGVLVHRARKQLRSKLNRLAPQRNSSVSKDPS